MADEFGPEIGATLLQDLVLADLGDVTGAVALASGASPKEVWLALCRANDVPESRWLGKNKKTKNQHADS